MMSLMSASRRATSVESLSRGTTASTFCLCGFVSSSSGRFCQMKPVTGTRFQQVLEDEVRMSAVFEDFLRNFYQLHRTEYRVRAEAPEWYVTDATEDDLAFLPRMITDITLRHPTHNNYRRKILQRSFSPGPYGKRVQSQHLYQLVTYLQHERIRQKDKGLSGMLIYPQVDRSLRLRYRLLGIPVMVATVDLSQEWLRSRHELHGLLDDCASAATGVGNIFLSAPLQIPAQSARTFVLESN